VAQATDGAYDSGSPGIWLYYSANVIANWSGSHLAAGDPGGNGSAGAGSSSSYGGRTGRPAWWSARRARSAPAT
jgi:hypothetical protein